MVTIIVIHGFLDRGSDYQDLVEALSDRWAVVAPDAPGHVEPLGHPLRAAEWLASVAEEVAAHDRCVLIGHSAGGHMAMLAAAAHPDRVLGVVCLDAPMSFRRDLMLSEPVQTALAGHRDDPVLGDVVHFLVEGDLDSFLEGFSEDAADPRISCPVLLVSGDPALGALTTQEDVERVSSVVADTRTLTHEGYGHDLGIGSGDVEPLVESITPFLVEVTAR